MYLRDKIYQFNKALCKHIKIFLKKYFITMPYIIVTEAPLSFGFFCFYI